MICNCKNFRMSPRHFRKDTSCYMYTTCIVVAPYCLLQCMMRGPYLCTLTCIHQIFQYHYMKLVSINIIQLPVTMLHYIEQSLRKDCMFQLLFQRRMLSHLAVLQHCHRYMYFNPRKSSLLLVFYQSSRTFQRPSCLCLTFQPSRFLKTSTQQAPSVFRLSVKWGVGVL